MKSCRLCYWVSQHKNRLTEGQQTKDAGRALVALFGHQQRNKPTTICRHPTSFPSAPLTVRCFVTGQSRARLLRNGLSLFITCPALPSWCRYPCSRRYTPTASMRSQLSRHVRILERHARHAPGLAANDAGSTIAKKSGSYPDTHGAGLEI